MTSKSHNSAVHRIPRLAGEHSCGWKRRGYKFPDLLDIWPRIGDEMDATPRQRWTVWLDGESKTELEG